MSAKSPQDVRRSLTITRCDQRPPTTRTPPIPGPPSSTAQEAGVARQRRIALQGGVRGPSPLVPTLCGPRVCCPVAPRRFTSRSTKPVGDTLRTHQRRARRRARRADRRTGARTGRVSWSLTRGRDGPCVLTPPRSTSMFTTSAPQSPPFCLSKVSQPCCRPTALLWAHPRRRQETARQASARPLTVAAESSVPRAQL